MIAFERCWHRDQKRICRFRLSGGPKVPLTYRSLDYDIQLRFDNVNFATINSINGMLIDIHTYDFYFSRSQHRCSR